MHLERLTHILEIVGQRGSANVADICAHSGLPKPTVYRLVKDLSEVGLLDPVARGQFAIGSRLKRMTQSDHSDAALLDVITPTLKATAAEFGAACFLARLRGNAVEIIHVETPETGVSYLHPGLGQRPLHACSCSKAVAAYSPQAFPPDQMVGRLRAYTEFTVTNPSDLAAEFATIRERGFAECVEELERGMCSIAAPLATTGLGATMSIGTTGSARVFTPTFRQKQGPRIKKIARDIGDCLGFGAQAAS